uniref:Reverse transcriptase domain-containing protein n=1 Tax=Tanacetum cinerariifolium TaxID=118510 RepID=A0A6L2K0T0_TANCI|nr:hypothetical protein [Tanacetum cinerariifolium]
MNQNYFEPNPCYDSKSFDFDQPPQQFVNHQPQEILEVIPFIETQREKELREQEQAAPREQELLAQKQSAQEKEELPQNSDFRQLIGEMCGIKASAEQKQKQEEMMLEWPELCQEKELYRVHDSIKDLIGRAMNTMLLSINFKSQRLDMEKQEVKNIIKQATKCKTQTKSDEVIKSSVKNLFLIPSESEVTYDNKSECDVPVNDESSLIFTTFSNPLFDCNDDFTSSDDESLSVEDVPKENFKIYSNPLFDNEIISRVLGELAHIDPIPQGIEEADFDLEEEIRLVENLFDSHMEKIDLFLATDDIMSPGIENDDYDSEGNIYFLEELLSNDPLPISKNDSSNYDHHHDLSFPRPPPEPPDVEVFFDFEPDTGVLTTKVVKGISEHYVLMPNILPTLPTLDLDLSLHLLMIPSDPETRFSL